MKQRIYPVFLPQGGCHKICRYCHQNISGEEESAPDVLENLLLSPDDTQFDEVAFYGGSFTLLDKETRLRWLAAGSSLIRIGRAKGMRLSTSPAAISAELADELASYGVTTVELGVQSFDPNVLRFSNRCSSGPQEIVSACMILKKTGIKIGLHLMPGLPGADISEAFSSLTAALALKPDFLRIHPTLVLRGSALESDFHSGSYRPLALDVAVDLCAEMAQRAYDAGIPVARFGLQANDRLISGGIVAGPWHPAFGQLVRSRLWLQALLNLTAGDGTTVRLHPYDVSDAYGLKRGNLFHLEEAQRRISFVSDPSLTRFTFFTSNDPRIRSIYSRTT